MHTPKAILTLAAAGILGAAGGAAVVGVAGDGGTATTTTTVQAPDAGSRVQVADNGSKALTATQVYDLAKESVVFITADSQQGQATGSGFVISKDGLIVTNAHVVNGAQSVQVKIGDRAAQSAEVVGVDESSDLALLRADASGADLTPLALADSADLQVGDTVYAIGNPYGLDRTLTSGLVSALGRDITAPNGFTISGAIQTDAPINPGNSGGPLLDAHGRVVGVNSQILNGSGSSSGGNVGIGFAVASDTVKSVVSQLERTGKVAHAYLGVQSGPAESGGGAQVGAVVSGGPAEQAGIRAGDVIVGLDGHAVTDPGTLSGLVNAKAPGDRVELKVRRDGGEQTVTVTLGEQPAQASDSAAAPQQQAPAPDGGSPYGQPSPDGGGSPYGQPSPDGGGSPYGQPSPDGGGSPYGQPSPDGGGSPYGQIPEDLLEQLIP